MCITQLEVSDPSMSVLAEGRGGPKPYVLNKIVNTWKGQRKNNIFTNSIDLNNLQCRTFHTRVKAGSRIGPHNQDVISVIIGSFLDIISSSIIFYTSMLL